MSELHLACAADARYVAHSAAMLHSALTRGGGRIVAHYLHSPTFPPHEARELEHMFARYDGRIVFHEIADDQVAGLPVDDLFGAAMWYRVLLPDLLPTVERILYLDVDTIILERIAPLWELDLDGRLLAAVTNVCVEPNQAHPDDLGIAPTAYFNSGVLMLNLDRMREEAFSDQLLDRVKDQGGSLLWPDQDALNLAAASRRLELHPRWNSMNSLRVAPSRANALFGETTVTDAIERAAIRHFEGPRANKPWHLLHGHHGRGLYDQHRRATPWPNYTPDGNTARNRLTRLYRDVRRRGPFRPARARGQGARTTR